MEHAITVVERVDAEFKEAFGRGYGLLETVHCDDAELVLLTTATITSTARHALKSLRDKGLKVGLCKLRLFRPFPNTLLRKTLENVPRIAVIERNISLGQGGIFCSEVKSALVNSPGQRMVQGYLAGIGGTDVSPELIEKIALNALNRESATDVPIWCDEENIDETEAANE